MKYLPMLFVNLLVLLVGVCVGVAIAPKETTKTCCSVREVGTSLNPVLTVCEDVKK